MKKFVGLLIAGAVVLAPSAVFADTSVVISGVVGSGPTVEVTTTTSTVAPLSARDAKKQAEADKKETHREAEAAKKADKAENKAEKELRVDDSFDPQSASLNDPSLIHNGGLKFG